MVTTAVVVVLVALCLYTIILILTKQSTLNMAKKKKLRYQTMQTFERQLSSLHVHQRTKFDVSQRIHCICKLTPICINVSFRYYDKGYLFVLYCRS